MEELVQKIISATGMTKEEVEKKIEEKQHELSDLVSKEGAAYIVAKEIGLDLIKRPKREIKIKDIALGMRSINIPVRIARKFEAKEFEKDQRKFCVGNLILNDGTGKIRLSLWDKQTEVLEILNEGDCIEIFGAYTKENNRGELELRIGRDGGMKILENSNLPEIKLENGNSITKLKPGDISEIRASVVQLFETETFYEICEKCGKRVKNTNGKWICTEHGEVNSQLTIVVSGVIDDGTGNIRIVFFRELGAKILGMTLDDVIAKRGRLFEGLDILGKEFIFSGRARENKMFKRLEFIATDVKEVDVKMEIEKMIGALNE